jgi:hypothetical protein
MEQFNDFAVFHGSREEACPNRAWARAGRIGGVYGICLGHGFSCVGFIPEAEVPQAIANMRAEAGEDDFRVSLLEFAERDLPILRNRLLDEITRACPDRLGMINTTRNGGTN